MAGFAAAVVAIWLTAPAESPAHVSFATADGGIVHADVYGVGGRGVVLAHGGRFDKASWRKQAQALASEI